MAFACHLINFFFSFLFMHSVLSFQTFYSHFIPIPFSSLFFILSLSFLTTTFFTYENVGSCWQKKKRNATLHCLLRISRNIRSSVSFPLYLLFRGMMVAWIFTFLVKIPNLIPMYVFFNMDELWRFSVSLLSCFVYKPYNAKYLLKAKPLYNDFALICFKGLKTADIFNRNIY